MNVPAKLGAFGLALAAAFGAGLAVGDAVGPIDVAGDTDARDTPAHNMPFDDDGHD